jgi:small subunit ribosomal protein S6
MKSEYELMVILKPMLPEDIRTGVEKKIESMIKKFKGEVVSVDEWGKKHLAYKIGKHEEGYYIIYSFTMPGKKTDEFKSGLKLMADIIRFMVVRQDNQ